MDGGVSGPMGHSPIQESFQSHGPQKTPTDEKTNKFSKISLENFGIWFLSIFKRKTSTLRSYSSDSISLPGSPKAADVARNELSGDELPAKGGKVSDKIAGDLQKAGPSWATITINNVKYNLDLHSGLGEHLVSWGEHTYLDKIVATPINKNSPNLVFIDRRELGEGFTYVGIEASKAPNPDAERSPRVKVHKRRAQKTFTKEVPSTKKIVSGSFSLPAERGKVSKELQAQFILNPTSIKIDSVEYDLTIERGQGGNEVVSGTTYFFDKIVATPKGGNSPNLVFIDRRELGKGFTYEGKEASKVAGTAAKSSHRVKKMSPKSRLTDIQKMAPYQIKALKPETIQQFSEPQQKVLFNKHKNILSIPQLDAFKAIDEYDIDEAKQQKKAFELLNPILTDFANAKLENDGQRIQLLNKIVSKTVTGENRDYLSTELRNIDLESSIESKAVDSHTEKYNRIKQALDELPDSTEKSQVILKLKELVKELGVTTS